MSSILFVLLLLYGITIGVFMFGAISCDPTTVAFYGSVCALSDKLAELLMYCYLSENVTSDLGATGDAFFHSLWYRLPIKLQKLYIIPIQQSQKEFRLTGLGIVECSLRIFITV